MRFAFGLLLVCLVAIVGRETAAEQPKPPDNAALVRNDSQFAVDLYVQLNREQGGKNLFFSPMSISLALAMTAAGAHGPTQAEMVKVLHLDADLAQTHAHYHQLLEKWNAAGQQRAYQLRMANRLWGQKGFPLRPEFRALTRQQYGSETMLLDFARPQTASEKINRWVEDQTNGKIAEIVRRESLTAKTRLVLTNAVYFKGAWVQTFDKRNTREEDFTISAKEKVKTPLMHRQLKAGYAEEPAFQMIEMPYAGRELSMVVFLPKKADGLQALERTITIDTLAELLSKLQVSEVSVYLPKFKLESSFDLKPTLKTMGMKHAFDKADFSRISSAEDVVISAVLHKAYVDVNEEGTEAAAATAVIISRGMATPPSEPIPEFRADHPFLFLIRDTKSGSILFMGHLTNPTK